MTAKINLQNVLEAYAHTEDGVLDNDTLYRRLSQEQQVDAEAFARTEPIGKGCVSHSPLKRKVRWFQQSLKMLGILERVPDQRGVWALSEKAGKSLHKAAAGVKLLAFSTQLGLAVWGSNREVLANWQDPIALCITSPPYPLRIPRDYGNPSQAQYVDFLCETLEPIVRSLLPGASIVLNIPNDIFEPNSPSRSLIPERLVLALHDRLGLSLMDRIPWVNYSKPPAPTYWACVQRYQLNSAYEMLYWFTNDPLQVRSDNRRVLQEHSRKHAELLAGGGEQRAATYGDGAYKIRQGSFSRQTKGKIPRNVLELGHRCGDTDQYRAVCQEQGLPSHGAAYPTSIPEFFIRFLTEPGELVVDLFAGTGKTGLAAERLGRRWLLTEWMLEYVMGSSALFAGFPGYVNNLA